MFESTKNWLKKLRPEDPRRMVQFREELKGASWENESLIQSLSKLFGSVDSLAEAEVRYYYRRRGTRAWLSGWFRILAWVLGSIGIIFPLLSATDAPILKPLGQFGYPLLAAAASLLAANALFGGSTGHVRFVSTQLELEKLIALSRISWCEYVARDRSTGLTEADIEEGFKQIRTYAETLYDLTIAETGNWGETLLAELLKYQKTIDAQTKAALGSQAKPAIGAQTKATK